MPSRPLILDQVLSHGDRFASSIYLTQPVGGGQVVDYTWARCV